MVRKKTIEEIEILREGGLKLAAILDAVAKSVRPGVSTEDLERMALELIIKVGGRPAFKNYPMPDGKNFPTALCTSINSEVVHGPAIPARVLQSGDIIGIDVGMEYPAKNGLYTDMAKTVAVGKVDKKVKKLMQVTEKALCLGIKKVKPGNTLNDIGQTIQEYVESHGFSIVRELVGHGVGFEVHEEPQVPNYKIGKAENLVLETGMVIAIEPMVNMGGWRIKGGRDGFSIVTYDGSLSAHYEHTVAVVEDGCLIITEL